MEKRRKAKNVTTADSSGAEGAQEAPRRRRAVVPAHQQSGELLEDEEKKDATFRDIGLCEELCAACAEAGWKYPTRIQAATVPAVVAGQDIVGVAQTGSGKTGAYVLPLVQWLLEQPKPPFLCILVMVPTRELAQQVTAQFEMLGRSVGLRVATLVGGVDMVAQAVDLSKRPHVIVGTPGRIKDHLANTKGFRLVKLHALVLDEADKMLDMDYEKEIDAILDQLPRERQTLLFSATVSAKIDRLQKASLRNPTTLEVNRANTTVETLRQFYIFAPFTQMLAYLHYYLTKENAGNHILIFCQSAVLVQKLCVTLRLLSHQALPLTGRMTQDNRNKSLTQFKDGKVRVLVCTDLAQRGLDIPHTDVVVNYGLPQGIKDYIHRVGRTARAGSAGKAINLISQYDIIQLQNIEQATGVRCEEWPVPERDVHAMLQRVEDNEQEAIRQIREEEQMDKLESQERNLMVAREGKRVRSSSVGDDDSRHAMADHGTLRIRRENEEVFGMTKKQQHKSLWARRRDSRKSSRKS